MLLLWIFRFFVFNLYESPKYLMGRGKDAEAVEIVHKVARYNGVTSNLTVEVLERVGKYGGEVGSGVDTSALGAIKRKVSMFSGDHVRALFATRKLAWNASVLIVLWGTFSFSSMTGCRYSHPVAFIGLAFPLYNSFVTYYLATRGADFGDGSVYITCKFPRFLFMQARVESLTTLLQIVIKSS